MDWPKSGAFDNNKTGGCFIASAVVSPPKILDIDLGVINNVPGG